ncbi:MAG: chromate transporter [Firmicutes bacterium]|nr:chromate transporter [Bacillota bacterium]
MIYLQLFFEFLKIGMFSVGGGMATLPFLYDLSDKTGWFTHAQIADMLAVSESTPGPMGINMATYVGYTVAGIPGSILASVGLILPGVILVLLIMAVLEKFRNNKYVEGAFYGLRPASVGLIAAAGILVARIAFLSSDSPVTVSEFLNGISIKAVILAVILLILTRGVKATKNLHPVVFIGFSALVGIVFSFAGV